MALNIEFKNQSKRVKATPGTTMFQVLGAAREQLRLDGSRQYQLLHRGKPIDLSLPFRLTGISNNATVELTELAGEAAGVQQVRVCVQLRDGKRVQAPFGSDSTIERILDFFQLLPASQSFSLGFMRREIEADAFATTTLEELGILSGSAIFRVKVAEGKLPANTSSAPNTSVANMTVAEEKPRVSIAPSAVPPPAPTVELPASVLAPQDEDEEMKEEGPDETMQTPPEQKKSVERPGMHSHEALKLLRDSSFDTVSRGAIMTLMKIVTNVLSHPDNEKMRSIRLSNAAFSRSVGQVKGGLEFLKAVGFIIEEETQMLRMLSVSRCKDLLEEGLRLLYVEADDLNIAADARPVVVEEKPIDPTFDVFKTQITRMQMQPRGPSTTEVLVGALKSKQNELVGSEKPARNTTVSLSGKRASARMDSVGSSVGSEQSDSQLLISSLKARREEMERMKNFRTNAMRELDELKRKKVFQTALIRVQFPDRGVMQAVFHPNETVQDVMDHVKECLSADYAEHKFYLYVTPPTQKLAPAKTLAELSIVPAALTYLSWLDAPAQLEPASVGFYFRRELVVEENAESKESSDGLEQVEYPKPIALEPPPETASSVTATAQPKQSTSGAKATKSGKKPSWLKL